jgi:hypothetical protein
MNNLSKADAQRRADDIRIFREELERLQTANVLALTADQRAALALHHDALLAGYAQSFDIDRDRHAKQLSLGMRIASFLGALALAARRSASRLFVVDVAPRARYPDRRMYAIVRGSLEVFVADGLGPRHVVARIHKIDVDAIRVPHAHREIVEPFVEPGAYSQNGEPRYVATVNFGQRLEPWIADLARLE